MAKGIFIYLILSFNNNFKIIIKKKNIYIYIYIQNIDYKKKKSFKI